MKSKKSTKSSKTLREKRTSKKPKFASGTSVSEKKGLQLQQKARASSSLPPVAIVLDRVAKTFARLQEQRDMTGTPVLDGFLEHADARGLIHNLTHEPVGAVAVISSRENTVRANHYHKEDAHLCYVVKGRIEYYERAVGDVGPGEKWVFTEGQGFYTGPMLEHAMYFPIETVFITLGRLSRTTADYERDLVRLTADRLLATPHEAMPAEPTPPTPEIPPEPTTPPAAEV